MGCIEVGFGGWVGGRGFGGEEVAGGLVYRSREPLKFLTKGAIF